MSTTGIMFLEAMPARINPSLLSNPHTLNEDKLS